MRTTQVFDSSALLPLLVRMPGQQHAVEASYGTDIVVPHIADAEVLHGLRGLWLGGVIDEPRLVVAAGDLEAMPIPRFGMEGLHQRVLQLRQNLTAYDATFVALAEVLELELVTYDRAMATAPGIRCDVILLEG
ncbi:MAG: PilT protein domain protein [Ilumatobacteraceae bacterium]|nr:PilT protein domain protein [Ilumatobacteraceae bacterium]